MEHGETFEFNNVDELVRMDPSLELEKIQQEQGEILVSHLNQNVHPSGIDNSQIHQSAYDANTKTIYPVNQLHSYSNATASFENNAPHSNLGVGNNIEIDRAIACLTLKDCLILLEERKKQNRAISMIEHQDFVHLLTLTQRIRAFENVMRKKSGKDDDKEAHKEADKEVDKEADKEAGKKVSFASMIAQLASSEPSQQGSKKRNTILAQSYVRQLRKANKGVASKEVDKEADKEAGKKVSIASMIAQLASSEPSRKGSKKRNTILVQSCVRQMRKASEEVANDHYRPGEVIFLQNFLMSTEVKEQMNVFKHKILQRHYQKRTKFPPGYLNEICCALEKRYNIQIPRASDAFNDVRNYSKKFADYKMEYTLMRLTSQLDLCYKIYFGADTAKDFHQQPCGGSTNISDQRVEGSRRVPNGNGEKKYPHHITTTLSEWIIDNIEAPYPIAHDYGILQKETNLSHQQLINSFTNFRKRNDAKAFAKKLKGKKHIECSNALHAVFSKKYKDKKELKKALKAFFKENGVGRSPQHASGWLLMKCVEDGTYRYRPEPKEVKNPSQITQLKE